MPNPTDTAGLSDVVEALRRADVPISVAKSGLVIDGVRVRVEVKRLAVVTPAVARGLEPPAADGVGIVLADRISEDARRDLAERGWGWIDRRGHVRLWAKGLRIATDVEPLRAATPSTRFSSEFPPVGIEVALSLLKQPDREWTVKDLAASIGRAASGVSERLRALRDAGLVDRRNRPIGPELFWELVGPWHERAVGLASFPGLAGQLGQLTWLGLPSDWVLTDTQAALILGAPVIVTGDGPPDFYVPQPSIVDLAVSHFGAAHSEPAATVRSSRYAGIHDADPYRRTLNGFPVAHPVVVALDLAHDRARGREIVEGWDPTPLGLDRVW